MYNYEFRFEKKSLVEKITILEVLITYHLCLLFSSPSFETEKKTAEWAC